MPLPPDAVLVNQKKSGGLPPDAVPVNQSWENSPVNAPSLTSVQPQQGDQVFTESGGFENLPGVAAKQAVMNQADVNKQHALMSGNVQETALKAQATELAKKDIARKDFNTALDSFLSIDTNIPRGEGFNMFTEGLKNFGSEIIPSDIRGRLVRAHGKVSDNLKTAIARMRDVGNLNQNEQDAAKQLIPSVWDEQGVVDIKRAYLKQMSTAVESGDKNLVVELIDKWKKDAAFDAEKHAQDTHANTDVKKYFNRKSSLSGFKI